MNIETVGKQAIVLGASMTGLMAAATLARHFEQVLVIERDEPGEQIEPRKGVPQSHHAHALLKSGERAITKLFPKFVEDLIASGSHQIDMSGDASWFHAGYWKMRYQSGFKIMVQSRPLLENTLRNRVSQIDNIRFYYGYELANLVASEDKSAIIGVEIQTKKESKQIKFLHSDLFVDGSGRGSKTPQWLENLGYARPEETRVKIDLSYSSRVYEAPQSPDWKLKVINPHSPETVRAGYIFPIEGNRWLVTLAGYSGDQTPTDNDSFVEFSKGLASPDIYHIIKDLKPLTNVKKFSIPATVKRHYEKISRFPEGMIVMGDAICAFDPVFGQGMSAAALEAVALDEMLAKENSKSMKTFPKRFHKKAAQILMTPYLMGTSEDFRYPHTVGKQAFYLPILQWYSLQVFELSAWDKEVYEAFRDVMHLIAGPLALFKPAIAWKVLKHGFRKNKKAAVELKRQTSTVPSI